MALRRRYRSGFCQLLCRKRKWVALLKCDFILLMLRFSPTSQAGKGALPKSPVSPSSPSKPMSPLSARQSKNSSAVSSPVSGSTLPGSSAWVVADGSMRGGPSSPMHRLASRSDGAPVKHVEMDPAAAAQNVSEGSEGPQPAVSSAGPFAPYAASPLDPSSSWPTEFIAMDAETEKGQEADEEQGSEVEQRSSLPGHGGVRDEEVGYKGPYRAEDQERGGEESDAAAGIQAVADDSNEAHGVHWDDADPLLQSVAAELAAALPRGDPLGGHSGAESAAADVGDARPQPARSRSSSSAARANRAKSAGVKLARVSLAEPAPLVALPPFPPSQILKADSLAPPSRQPSASSKRRPSPLAKLDSRVSQVI